MDPLVLASLNRAVVFFMTRSDIFTAFTRPLFWMAHMLPIYRQRDGVNTKTKNQEVFRKSSDALQRNRGILIFGEGVTDDVFIRRLKPIKKGALRIGFTALVACNWKRDIYLATVACNYSNPSEFRSDILIRNSNKIRLNDFKSEYQANSNKIIQELTVKLENTLKNDLIHVNNEDDAEFTERLLLIQRKGMPKFIEANEGLGERWAFTKKLVDDFNLNTEKYAELKAPMNTYFSNLEKRGLNDQEFYDANYNAIGFKDLLKRFILLPLSIFGAFHCGIFYILTKGYVESNFKRPVFWGSTKLVMMMFIAGFLNLSVFFLLPKHIGTWGTLLYFLAIPIAGWVFHDLVSFTKRFGRERKIHSMNVSDLLKERLTLKENIVAIVPI